MVNMVDKVDHVEFDFAASVYQPGLRTPPTSELTTPNLSPTVPISVLQKPYNWQ